MEKHQVNNIDKALKIALNSHAGQLDKANQPYILHPLRLMLKFRTESEMTIAVLHDVVEDSNTSLSDLKAAGFTNEVITAVDCLTKRENETYDNFILRSSLNELARRVKIEDLKDNLDLTRIDSIDKKDLARVEKYHKALKFLLNQMT